jgi:hypothetical protein
MFLYFTEDVKFAKRVTIFEEEFFWISSPKTLKDEWGLNFFKSCDIAYTASHTKKR